MRVACIWFEQPVATAKIAEIFLRLSPQICVRGERAIFVEIGKCSRLYSESSFLARAHALLRRNGCVAKIRIAEEVTAALALAMYPLVPRIEELPLASLLEFADPFERDFVLRTEVSKIVSAFQDLGVRNLGQFQRLPVAELISRFGIIGRHCHNRVHFKDLVGWPKWKPEEVLVEKTDFPYFEFYGELEPILFALKSQLDRLFLRLFARGRRATKLQLQIRCEKVSTHPEFLRTLDFPFFTPQSAVKGTLRIFQERLAREFERRPILSPIESIQTQVLNAVEFRGGQKNIFNSDEEKQELIHSVHNQLIELLGPENVYEAVLTQDRRPERSWKKKQDSPHEFVPQSFAISELIPERPTYLCRRPVKVEITAGFIFINKNRYRILHWDNQVEKISGGWYEKPVAEIQDSFDRNYYRLQIEENREIVVFETPQREYFLHGYFG